MDKKRRLGRKAKLGQLGSRLREMRKARGLTQSQLAEAIGVDISYISKIEKGRLSYTPSEQTLRLMAQTLEADPLELLSLAEKTPDELKPAAESQPAREFFELVRGRHLKTDDWEDITRLLRRRLAQRGEKGR